LRGALIFTAALSALLFVGIGIGWLWAHITRDLNSSATLTAEFVHPWNNHGATLYMTDSQRYWVELFDRLSDWCLALWLSAMACWCGFVIIRGKRE